MVISEIRANSKIRAPSERGGPDREGSTVIAFNNIPIVKSVTMTYHIHNINYFAIINCK